MASEKIFTRDYILTFFAQSGYSFGNSALVPTLPIYLSGLGSREEEIGILIGILSISSLFLRPLVGRALQRIPERSMLVWGALLSVLTSIAYQVASPFWPFLLARVLQGVGLAFFFTASHTLIANITPETRRGQGLGYFYLSMNIPFAVAPAVGVVLITRFGPAVLFWFCTAVGLCCLLLSYRLNKRPAFFSTDPPPRISFFLKRESLPPYFVSFFTHIIWGTMSAFLPLFALEHGVSNPGVLFSILALMLILGRIFGGRILDVYRREQVILPCLVTYTIAMAILVFSRTFPMFIVVVILWGGGHSLLYPSLVASTIDHVRSSRGYTMGIFTGIGDLGMGLGPIMMGTVVQSVGYPAMFLCLVLTGMINLSYFYLLVVRKKEP